MVLLFDEEYESTMFDMGRSSGFGSRPTGPSFSPIREEHPDYFTPGWGGGGYAEPDPSFGWDFWGQGAANEEPEYIGFDDPFRPAWETRDIGGRSRGGSWEPRDLIDLSAWDGGGMDTMQPGLEDFGGRPSSDPGYGGGMIGEDWGRDTSMLGDVGMNMASGERFLGSMGIDTSGLPDEWYFPVRQAVDVGAAPATWITAGLGPNVPIVGSAFGGSAVARTLGEIGLGTLGTVAGQEAAGGVAAYGETDMPFSGVAANPWVQAGAGLAGGFGAAGLGLAGVKNPDSLVVKAGKSWREMAEKGGQAVQNAGTYKLSDTPLPDWKRVDKLEGKKPELGGFIRQTPDGKWEAAMYVNADGSPGGLIGAFDSEDAAARQFLRAEDSRPEVKDYTAPRTVADVWKAIRDGEEGSARPLFGLTDAGPALRKKFFGSLAEREGRDMDAPWARSILPTESATRGGLALYEGGIGTGLTAVGRDVRKGNAQLRKVPGVKGTNTGRRFEARRTPDMETLFRALHGEVDRGTLSPQMQGIFDDLKRIIGAETDATLRDNPDFILRDDYFYRGWRAPKRTSAGATRLGATPGYAKPRTDATFSELLAEGWEPQSWNPYEMAALRVQAGVRFREGKELVQFLKDAGVAVKVEGAIPEGYRVPRVGPAFEGKPYAFTPSARPGELLDTSPGSVVAYTNKFAVPESVAERIETIFGREPSFGKVLDGVIHTGEKVKRLKLFGSLFQQVDFGTRATGSTLAGMLEQMRQGHPIGAAKLSVKAPVTIGKMMMANVNPKYREGLLDDVLSDTPLFKGRGVSLKQVSEAGWKGHDTSVVRDTVRASLDDAVKGPGNPKLVGAPLRALKRLNQATQDGLFDGVYRVAQIAAIKDHIGPRLLAQHPDWTDAQIARAIADNVNMRFSTLGDYQTLIQNPFVKKMARGLIFSTNESESLIRQTLAAVWGGDRVMATEYLLGTALGLAVAANGIHYLTTGEMLPGDRYSPVNIKDGKPAYNSRFLAPNVPLKGRGGTDVTLDLVGQMDTVFRLLEPKSFIQARENVIPRAAATQLAGKDFFDRPLKGPGDRIATALNETLMPIGGQQVAGALKSADKLGRLDPYVTESEGRLGTVGQALQGTGMNFRAETNTQLRDRLAQAKYGKPWSELTSLQKGEVETANPQQFQELETRRDEGVASGQEWAIQQKSAETIRTDRTAAEAKAAAQFAKDGDGVALRDALSSAADVARGEFKQLYGDQPFAPTVPEDQAVRAYFDAMDASRDAYGRIDQDAFEKTLAGVEKDWTEGQKQYVDAFLGRRKEHSDPVMQRYYDDLAAIRDSGYWDVEKDKAKWRRAHPGVDELLRKYDFGATTSKAMDYDAVTQREQAGSDARLERGELTAEQWREDFDKRATGRAAAMRALWSDMPADEKREAGPLTAYYSVIAGAKREDGSVDWNRVDGWLSQQSAETQRAVKEREAPAWQTPAAREFVADRSKIAESGYWDMDNEIAQDFARQMGLGEYATAPEMRQDIWRQYREMYMAEGYSERDAELIANIGTDQLLKPYTSYMTKLNDWWRKQPENWEIAQLLIKWEYWTPGREDTGAIVGAGR